DNSADIQTRVLQTTLANIQTSRQTQSAADVPADVPADAPECCVICLDSISDPCAALPCTHAHFDFLCLVSWLQEHPNCPLCKADVYKVRHADPQNGESFYRVPNAGKTPDSTTRRDEPAAAHNRQAYTDSAPPRRFTSRNGILLDTGRRYTRPRDPTPRSPPTPSEAIQRRRHIYRHNLYSLHIGSNRHSRYRPAPTPTQLSSTPHLLTRARLWLRRELQVFTFLSSPSTTTTTTTNTNTTNNNAEFLLEYLVAILKTVDIQGAAGAGQAEALLAGFLGRRAHARLFLHELCCWLRSPAAGLTAWDREVQYP
ncbi:hypothetical protein BT67DRAFT_409560, partial [Trichocladium antarcticum]